MKITYYEDIEMGNVITDIVFGKIDFNNGKAFYSCMGHRCCVDVEDIVAIEPIEED